MSKLTKVIVSSSVLLTIGAVCVISNTPTAPSGAFAVGQRIAVPPKYFDTVKVQNLEPVYEERHSICNQPDQKQTNKWTAGDQCEIGNENYAFELIVVAMADADHVLLRYERTGHDHVLWDKVKRCPQATLFLESPTWVSARMADYEAYVATRAPVTAALAKESVAASKPVVVTSLTPKSEPPAPMFHAGQLINLQDGFKEKVVVQNPEGASETRNISETSKKETFLLVKFGKACVVLEDGKMHSYVVIVGIDGDDVLLRWFHPGWHFFGKEEAHTCPQEAMFFRSTAWVKLRLAEEAAWRAKRSKVLKVLGK